MRRHPSLMQLSREHHAALRLALYCRTVAKNSDEVTYSHACCEIAALFKAELEPHFYVEETQLLPVLSGLGETGMVARTLAEHHMLRHLADGIGQGNRTALELFADALVDHVRFEERELFQKAQTCPEFSLN